MTDIFELQKLFELRSIAIIGVSDDPTKGAMGFLRSLIAMGFPGNIYPVHPQLDEVMGFKTYPRVSRLPDPVDYAIIGVPASKVPGVIKDCVEKGIPFAQIFTSGFGEIGSREGADLEKTIVDIAKGKLRIIGPNCMGIYFPKARIGFEPEQPLEPGTVSFISQSGGLSMSFVDRSVSEKIAVSKLISIGNACDLQVTDFLTYFKEDSETEIVGIYLEGLRKGEHRVFFRLTQEMTSKKPLVLWKSGYTDAGARAARSHTGSMVGSYNLWKSVSRQTGIIPVDNMGELVDAISLFKRAPLPGGKNVGIVAFGGGTSVTATDACTSRGLWLPKIQEEIQDKMLNYIPEAGTFRSNPVDITGWVTSPRISRGVSLLVGSDPGIHALIFILDIDFISKQCNRLNLDKQRLSKGHAKSLMQIKQKIGKPVLCVLQKTRDDMNMEILRLHIKEYLQEVDIPPFQSIERAAAALSRLADYGAYLRKNLH